MSWVWSVLLSCSRVEFCPDDEGAAAETCEPLDRINQWIPSGKLVSLVQPTYAKGAGYGMDAFLFGGGYKHFDIEGFVAVVEAQAWREPTKVQLWVKGAEEGLGDDLFTEIRLRPQRIRRTRERVIPSKPKASTKVR